MITDLDTKVTTNPTTYTQLDGHVGTLEGFQDLGEPNQ